MLDFRCILLEDRLLFNEFLAMNEIQTSELTFTNLFMWRNHYNYRFSVENGLLCIIATGTDTIEPFAFFPIGKCNDTKLIETIQSLSIYFDKYIGKLQFKRVSEFQLSIMKALFLGRVTVSSDPNNDDYVYLTKDLISLKGKKYHDKRNHINKFKDSHSFHYVPLTQELLQTSKQIIEHWYIEKTSETPEELLAEKAANFELMDHYFSLECKGALLMVDGSFEALAIGEMLNANTAVIHLEKANKEIHGLYAMINQQFCMHEWQETTCINREQDLGIVGLRKAKLSYNPIALIKKYIVELNSDRNLQS